MIYDCFMFYNELELLEIRFNELNEVVDKFVIVESSKTFTNQPKKLIFDENKQKFSAFKEKIIHIVIDEFPGCKSAWECEIFQRNAIEKGLKSCKPDEIIIISDVDEIPNAKALANCINFEGIKVLKQNQYNFYLNYINDKEPYWLRGPRVLFYKDFSKTANEIRNIQGQIIENGGWHFSFLGGIQKVKEKIQSFAHQEYNNEYYLNEVRLNNLILDGVDIFERGYKYKIVNIDNTFPEYIVKNKEKYKNLILKTAPVFHRLKNILIQSKRHDKKYVDTINPINDNPILDFIAPTSKKVLEIGTSEGLKEIISKKFNLTDYFNAEINNGVCEVDTLSEDYFDCAILDETLPQLYNPIEILNKIKPKLNKNGYVLMVIPNFRYIKILNQIIFKKNFQYKELGVLSEKNIRFFTRKSLFDAISKSGYFAITLKGLNPDNSLEFLIKNAITFNNLYDCKHEKFLCVIKC
ncbi:MAG: hypothetical protein WCG23_07375 [bacterium]